ncbi:inositol-3-phosphate synthase [Edaphobacter albus]|uniref:inositol-3-phosphate synthase n=1 Tax=Edaphobacter sp. 4G125 TaxID=2763071 RepID=UPI0016450BFE|nr:inositol-3-phosphate synthase [Edaphobacter sp. 4G125]QNI35432.1 inositol-3-phosphate synthase [Edaphobacter sp. 4G125]
MSTTQAENKEATSSIKPAQGKLGVMIPGMGAVATTLIAGVEAVRRGMALPIGSTSQMGTIRLGKRTDSRSPLIKDFVPLAPLDDLVFTGWDIFGGNLYDAAKTAQVLDNDQLQQMRPFLESIEPMPAAFNQHYVKRLEGKKVKTGKNKCDLANQIRNDIAEFKTKTDRQVMIWCGSTEIFMEQAPVHQTLAAFEKGLVEDDPAITPSMLYAWAALKEGIPFINGAPNLTVDIPALNELSRKMNAPIAGKDFKTGQTFIKTVLAPAFKVRNLGVSGWYSTNILGNRDGEVLDDPESFKTKEVSKLGVLEYIFQPELHPELYKDLYHKVRINYYPPRGDNKEGWDNIDIFGWLGYPMQLKVDFLCRDSILAAPLALDLILFMDLAARTPSLRGLGIQEWLSFYFKDPDSAPGVYPEHDLFIQNMKLKNTLRHIMGEDLITHLGLDYYGD